jgi:hypothetical protein
MNVTELIFNVTHACSTNFCKELLNHISWKFDSLITDTRSNNTVKKNLNYYSLGATVYFLKAELNVVTYRAVDTVSSKPSSTWQPLHSRATWRQVFQLKLSKCAALLDLDIYQWQNNAVSVTQNIYLYITCTLFLRTSRLKCILGYLNWFLWHHAEWDC